MLLSDIYARDMYHSKVLVVLHVCAEALAEGDLVSALLDDLNYMSYVDGVCNLVRPPPPPPPPSPSGHLASS